MRLWTVQPVAVWEQLRADGHAVVDPARVNPEGWVHPRYAWLARELRARIAGRRGRLPWWAYCARPDLRWVRHSRPAGSHEVRIEFEAPDGTFADFPCWAWNEVFYGSFLALSGTEYRAWRARLRLAGVSEDEEPLPEPFQAELEASWRRLFRPDLPARSWRRADRRRAREAVALALRRQWVRDAPEFVGTGAWMSGRSVAGPLSPKRAR
jgi:hypothetical protein